MLTSCLTEVQHRHETESLEPESPVCHTRTDTHTAEPIKQRRKENTEGTKSGSVHQPSTTSCPARELCSCGCVPFVSSYLLTESEVTHKHTTRTKSRKSSVVINSPSPPRRWSVRESPQHPVPLASSIRRTTTHYVSIR